MSLTYKDYRDALDVQSACNLSGVVQAFANVVPRIWEEAHEQGLGTDFVNKHPISRLYAEQIAHLTSGEIGDGASYSAAYAACQEGAKESGAETAVSQADKVVSSKLSVADVDQKLKDWGPVSTQRN